MYRQWVPCGLNSSYSLGTIPVTVFHQLFWNISDVFSMECTLPCAGVRNDNIHHLQHMEWRCACGFGIILWFFFSHFFCFVNFVSSFFFKWNAIKVYRQWVPCGRNSSYSFPSIVLKHCECFRHGMKMCMWFGYNTLIFFFFFHFFCFVN